MDLVINGYELLALQKSLIDLSKAELSVFLRYDVIKIGKKIEPFVAAINEACDFRKLPGFGAWEQEYRQLLQEHAVDGVIPPDKAEVWVSIEKSLEEKHSVFKNAFTEMQEDAHALKKEKVTIKDVGVILLSRLEDMNDIDLLSLWPIIDDNRDKE